ncbi:hypothetical protein [Agriterribacter sp.]|uniref:hypothetical protein n=1 Tax=Agriterribacter sp. TaxID=2821509 RepID=UPI002CE13997|nr:hypothetical protein [Agriterribacter sp.]HTN08421.1 hypothetical protein [Agriterribacter sp.]
MSLVKAIKRLEYANFLIRKKATGDLNTFAKKMKLSKSAVKHILCEMRDLGANIKYDKLRKYYYYEEDGEFCISRFMKYGEMLTKDKTAYIGKPEELCFSEKAVFVLCKDI